MTAETKADSKQIYVIDPTGGEARQGVGQNAALQAIERFKDPFLVAKPRLRPAAEDPAVGAGGVDQDAIHVSDGELRTAAGVTAGLDLALALVALVVVVLPDDDEGTAGLRCHECYHLQSTHCPSTVHSVPISR